MKSVSAADANREFSAVLRRVKAGNSYVVTSHGRPVARIVPVSAGERIVATAREKLFARLETTATVDVGRWTRDELYEKDR
jgi:prevent-host-death family protein